MENCEAEEGRCGVFIAVVLQYEQGTIIVAYFFCGGKTETITFISVITYDYSIDHV